MKLRLFVRGFLGYIPGLLDSIKDRKERTGSFSARYCYSVWLRHMIFLKEAGLNVHPSSLAEIGPGASLGIGLAALLSGSDNYFALDIIKHSDIERNLAMLEELFDLFKKKSQIPDIDEYPKILPLIHNVEFPDELINTSLITCERKEHIVNALKSINSGNKSDPITINYITPWSDHENISVNSLDLVISQAALEHITDLEHVFSAMKKWLKVGGFLSHQIDYKSHDTHTKWNGHWFFSRITWEILMKGRSYPINRKPHSYYKQLFEKHGFKIKLIKEDFSEDSIRKFPKGTIQYLQDDFNISGALFIAQK